MQKFFLFLLVFIFEVINESIAQQVNNNVLKAEDAIVGASRLELYINKLEKV